MTPALPPIVAIRIIRSRHEPAAEFTYHALSQGLYLCPEHRRPMKGSFTTENKGRGNVARVKFECGCTVEGPVLMPGEKVK